MSTQRSHIDYINHMIEKGDMKQFLRVLYPTKIILRQSVYENCH